MLFTIGYEGAALTDFIHSLQAEGIDILIDVRERAQSRRKGFSKTALSEALERVGIGYLHFRELGDPKEGREAARAGDIQKFKQIYANVVRRKAAQNAMDEIVKIAKKQSACLLCYEKDALTCHRKIITDRIFKDSNIASEHLKVTKIEPSKGGKRRVLHSSESAAASL